MQLPIPNVILFGETGGGKSSIVNLLAGSEVAPTASSARGCTFQSQRYQVDFPDSSFHIYDTAGLNEGETGSVPSADAIIQLYSLLQSLDTGVNLLVFCMRGPRLRSVAHDNWRFFQDIVCQKKVPIVLVITGLEHEDVMDRWWLDNKSAFQEQGMFPHGVACITAIKGKNNAFEAEYKESRVKMEHILTKCVLEKPWKIQPVEWFREITVTTFKTPWCPWVRECTEMQKVIGPGIEAMLDLYDLSVEEARKLGEQMSDVIHPPAYSSEK